jgi:hypothetical protein
MEPHANALVRSAGSLDVNRVAIDDSCPASIRFGSGGIDGQANKGNRPKNQNRCAPHISFRSSS